VADLEGSVGLVATGKLAAAVASAAAVSAAVLRASAHDLTFPWMFHEGEEARTAAVLGVSLHEAALHPTVSMGGVMAGAGRSVNTGLASAAEVHVMGDGEVGGSEATSAAAIGAQVVAKRGVAARSAPGSAWI